MHSERDWTSECRPLVAKLATVADLSDDDIALLHQLCRVGRNVGARRNIIREGDRPDFIHLIVDGWAARYKLVPDGGRQITALLIPGDFCDLHAALLGEMDHSIVTVTDARIAAVPRARMDALMERPGLAKAFWWSTLVDEAILRAWIVNVGRRDAFEAIGHLMCELYVRMKNIGLVNGHRFELPLTQEEIGDALGLTSVHVNRVLQRMRAAGLIELKRHTLDILDYGKLENEAGFNGNYLHIKRRVNSIHSNGT